MPSQEMQQFHVPLSVAVHWHGIPSEKVSSKEMSTFGSQAHTHQFEECWSGGHH